MKTLCQFFITIVYMLQSCITPTTETVHEKLMEPVLEQKQIQPAQSIVFITGHDEGQNTYYANAKAYFTALGMQVVIGQESLEEIIKWLAANHNYVQYATIHIVSHSNPWRGISLKAKKNGARMTLTELKSLKETVRLPILDGFVTADTKIVFHACGLGQNKELLEGLQTVFTAEEAPAVYASKYFTVFGGKYSGHYLAKPHFGYYPTAESPGPIALASAMKRRYPKTKIDWVMALKTRSETEPGQVFTYKFNIPVSWDFDLEALETPDVSRDFNDTEVLMDWIVQEETIATALFELGIPIEKYRWRAKRHDKKLSIRGKTTVLCVLQPVMDPKEPSEYQKIALEDTSLYQRL